VAFKRLTDCPEGERSLTEFLGDFRGMTVGAADFR
jgi:hypothetical protein